METVNDIVNEVGDTFKGLFNGGGDMSTGKKIALVVGAAILAAIILFVLYKIFFSGYGVGRRVGPAGCCGKLQNQRVMQVETSLSQQDIDESNADYSLAGTPKTNTFYNGLGFDNFSFCQGFSSPSAKPDSSYESPMSDHHGGTSGMVRQQVPTLPYQRPAIGEADFINMAYSA